MTQSREYPEPSENRQPIATHEIRGPGGVRLHAREWGRPDGPELLFIHGWSQCDLCWTKQINSPLADEFHIVTFDLRGHGLSEKPTGSENYCDSQLWADDLAAVLEQTALAKPVVVAWSYGGFVTCDYLRAYGDDRLAGIVFAAGAIEMTPSFHHIGPGLLENARGACTSDLAANVPAIERFVRACTVEALPDDEFLMMFGSTMAVPPEVRAGLFAREVDGRAAMADVSVPLLVAHGRADTIVVPSMTEEVLRCCDHAEVSWYEGVGHMPFWEAPDRFNGELARFASAAFSPA